MWLFLPSLLLLLPASHSTTPPLPLPVITTVTPTIPPTQPPYYLSVNLSDNDKDVVNYLILPQNENGVLECTSEDLSHTKLYWFKEGVELAVSTIRQAAELRIDGTNISRSGVYTCQSDSGTTKHATVFIEAEEINHSAEDIQDMDVEIQDEITFTLDLLVYPVSQLEYSLCFSRIKEKVAVKVATCPSDDLTSQVSVVQESNSLVYQVETVMPSNHGLYTFTVSYGDRELRYEYFVNVRYAPIISSFEGIPQFVALKEHVTMRTRVTGHPTPTITWWHEPCCPATTPTNITELLLREPGKVANYQLNTDNTILSLLDTEGTLVLNGSYWVEASNEMGAVMSDKSSYRLQGYGISVTSGTTENVTSKALEENIGSLQLTCVVAKTDLSQEDRTPDIVWYHNGVEVGGTTKISDDYESKEILQVAAPGVVAAGTYNCIAATSIVTLWSLGVHVTVTKQPIITVSPQVYLAAAGTTVIFSCHVDNIDLAGWEVLYKVKETHQTFTQVTSTIQGSEEEGMLYLPRHRTEGEVRCLTSPALHSQPVYRDGVVLLVKDPPVVLKVTTNRKRYTEGETLILRCHVTSELLKGNPSSVSWRQDGRVIGGSVGAERYYSAPTESDKTEVLLIENLAINNTGDYTCVFDTGEQGRYEDSYGISVHPAAPLNVIAYIIGVCFVCILVIIMGVVLYVVIKRSQTFSYSPAKHEESKMEQTSL